MEIKRIAVFCGSSRGTNEIYGEQAYLLGKTLAERNIGLVYGGANVGLMKEVADGALASGGEVIGVLPEFLMKKEIAHKGLSRIVLVSTMHERKYRMYQMCDGVIALPGSYGTMDEFFEMITWGQLGLHQKPVALLNVNSFYNSLIDLIRTMAEEGFLKKEYQDIMLTGSTIQEVLTQMEAYQAPAIPKWIK